MSNVDDSRLNWRSSTIHYYINDMSPVNLLVIVFLLHELQKKENNSDVTVRITTSFKEDMNSRRN